MPLVSTFELLVKQIAPTDGFENLPPDIAQNLKKVARRVVQGYFLTIANTTNATAALRLEFTATTPELNLKDTVIIVDTFGKNEFADLKPVPNEPKRFTFDLKIPAHDTVLVTLLPDLNNLDLLKGVKDLEIRGYVNISRLALKGPTYELLITPEQRGTFLPNNLNDKVPDFDQIAYSVPTASGGSFLSLKPLFFPEEIISIPLGDNSTSTNDRQELLDLMFERLDQLK
ncbi:MULTISPECIES: hypothetical protein [unclassified Nodularia (in: cyanobacteria)]|uniref:hypothetical protein n=1 Tax=unclassified Nodularia (in: cyanobacteria) TaxID=2656917 RepID=UPI001882B536|nr:MULTISPECIES: hypothetical protein [unclassified Nodularia (in: cyanobacteria)]MBE9198468.1 hypothetical protein [Nodularia sp. LEGE 06071]MCC2691067.1 hypothetical protein [Nodularia sp. LEGE 04288]